MIDYEIICRIKNGKILPKSLRQETVLNNFMNIKMKNKMAQI